MKSVPQYVPMQNANNLSEKIVHFLEWAHRNRPGERIALREIAQMVYQVSRPIASNIQSIRTRSHHVSKLLRETHKLGWDSDKDGMRAIDNVDDIAAQDLVPAVRELESKHKKVEQRIHLIEERGGLAAFTNSADGRKFAAFYSKVKTQSSKLKLPSRNEIRGLFVAAVPEK